MNIFISTIPMSPARQVAIRALAVVGFVALVAGGMWLAVYSTRYVPTVVNNMSAAAVYLGSVFTPSEATLSVVPMASTTISFGEASSTIVTAIDSAVNKLTVLTPSSPAPKTEGEKTSTIQQIGGSTSVVLSGLPDLVVQINALGYLTTSSADSFIASSTVPSGSRPAVSFTIKNIGTNVTGSWRFSASIPTQSAYLYYSQPQQSLNPGDSIDYTLGFDQATPGTGKMISVSANFDRAITESNFDNNSASAQITIIGG